VVGLVDFVQFHYIWVHANYLQGTYTLSSLFNTQRSPVHSPLMIHRSCRSTAPSPFTHFHMNRTRDANESRRWWLAHPHRMRDADQRMLWRLPHHIEREWEKVVVVDHGQTRGANELSCRWASHPHRTGDVNEKWYRRWHTLKHELRRGGGLSHPHRTRDANDVMLVLAHTQRT